MSSDSVLAYLQQLKSKNANIEVQDIEKISGISQIESYLENSSFHRLLLDLASSLLDLAQFANFNEILRFYMSHIPVDISKDDITSLKKNNSVIRNFLKLSNLFFVSIKSKQDIAEKNREISYNDLIVVYDNLIEALAMIHDESHLMYISNCMLSTGAKLRQQKDLVYLDYWRRSVSIELDLQDKPEPITSSSLPGKVERLAIALIENNLLSEAFEAISDTLGIIASTENILEKIQLAKPNHLVWTNSSSTERLFSIGTRILIDSFPSINPEFTNLSNEVEASALEQVLVQIGKSSRNTKQDLAVKIMQRLEVLLLPNHPLFFLRACNIFSKSIGSSYDTYNKGVIESLLTQTTENSEFSLDKPIFLSKQHYYIISGAALSAAAFSSIPTTKQYQYLSNAVLYTIEMLSLNVQSDNLNDIFAHIQSLSAFLDLQGAHEKRAELLKAARDSNLFKKEKEIQTEIFTFRLDLIKSLISLGYTGTAVREITSLSSEYSSLLPQLLPIDRAWLSLRQAESFVAIGETAKASTCFKQLFELIQSDNLLKIPLLDGRPASEDRNHFQQRALLFGEICNTLALLHTEQVRKKKKEIHINFL